MAHYRRKRSRINQNRGSTNDIKRLYADSNIRWAWWQNTPSHHHILYHTRPRRRQERQLEIAVMKGEDPENIIWPLSKKPHHYYW